jgi:hypothetical protein
LMRRLKRRLLQERQAHARQAVAAGTEEPGQAIILPFPRTTDEPAVRSAP